MTWTKIPDEWTDRREFSMLSADDRWHYLCMVVFCSRGDYSDGVLSLVQARRVSDHPNPDDAIARLEEIGLIEVSPAAPLIRLTEIDLHFPPPSKRADRTGAERQRRKRAHDKGDHTLCLPKHCPDAITGVTDRDAVTDTDGTPTEAKSRDMSRVTQTDRVPSHSQAKRGSRNAPVTPSVTRDLGTGRDGTALTTQPSTEVGDVTIYTATGEVNDWPTVAIPDDDDWAPSPDSPGIATGRGAR